MRFHHPVILAFVGATSVALHARSNAEAEQLRTATMSASIDAVSTAPDSSTFAQPGDVVRLRIWREPDMSGDFTVDANGVVTFPRLGAMRVTRTDVDSLQRLLIAGYAYYLKNPTIEVVLLRRIRVVGAVRSPGLYTADQTMRIRDILALAGGANPDGRRNEVTLRRSGHNSTVLLNSDLAAGEIPLQSGDELYVPERNWFARNTPLVTALISISAGLVVALAIR